MSSVRYVCFLLGLLPAFFEIALAQGIVPPRRYSDPAAETARLVQRRQLPSAGAGLPTLIPQRLAPVSEQEFTRVTRAPGGPALAGLHRALPEDWLRRGQWDFAGSGRQVWRLAVESPDAAGLRLHFTGFDAGGGRVWIHDGIGGQVHGPYTGRGIHGDGEFWSDFVLAPTITVEFEPATPMTAADPLPFRIDRVAHLLSGTLATEQDLSRPTLSLMDLIGRWIRKAASPERAVSAPCNLDVTCYPDWADTARAVGHIVFEAGGSFVCSGTLLNTRNGSGVPLFLTADHCISDNTTARTVQAFWFYQTRTCNGPPVSRRDAPRTLGATYLAGGGRAQGDFSLLRLNAVAEGVTFSGWNPDPLPNDTAVTVIHHPSGDYKRISFGTSRGAVPRPGANTDSYVGVLYSEGVTEGGSSGSGLFSQPGVLVGTLSNGPKADTPEGYCRISPFVDNYGRFSAAFPVLRDFLEDRTTVPPPAGGGSGGRALTSGQPATLNIPAQSSPTLLNGDNSFRIQVPQGATRLEIRLATSPANVDLDLFARFGQDTTVTDGRIVADHSSQGDTGAESLIITPQSSPPLRAGTYFISVAIFTRGVAATATVTATVTAGATPPPDGGDPGNLLTSGQPRQVRLGPVSGPTLFHGENSFRIVVPQNASRLEVRITTQPPNVDVDLFVRFNQDVALSGGNIVADHASVGPAGEESVVVTAATSPPLRAGTYFIALALFTASVQANVTLTATVTTGGGATPPPAGGVLLRSGESSGFSIGPVTNATLFNGENSFRIEVPQGATRLEVRVTTTTPNADVDLFVRFGQDNAVVGGSVVSDHASQGDGGNEVIVVTPASTPPLRSGTYFISLALFTPNVTAIGNVMATVSTGSTPPPAAGSTLTSGQPRTVNLPAVQQPTLFNGTGSFQIAVPQGASRLDVRLSTATPNVDLDLFVRFGQDTTVQNNRVVADFRSEGPTGEEFLSITPSSTPPLRAGTYFITLANFTPGVAVTATLTATVTSGGAAPPPGSGGPTLLTSGRPQNFSIAPVSSPTLLNGSRSFVISVPQGATRLEIRLSAQPATVDVDVFARFNQDVGLADGRVLTDHSSTGPAGEETITISPGSTPPLRAGNYFIALAMFTTNTSASGTITATVSTGGAPPPTGGDPQTLQPGRPTAFRVGPVANPTLFNGENSFRVVVPEGATRLDISVTTATPNADVDVFARFGSDTGVSDGAVIADHASNGPTGTEVISISQSTNPPLRPGTYFVSLALFTPNVEATGSITVLIAGGTGGGGVPPPPPSGNGTVLTPGTPAKFTFPAGDRPILYNGAYSFIVQVPEGTTRLTVRLTADNPAVDTDLYVRYNSDVVLDSGNLIADYESALPSANETIVITPGSVPPLRPGNYFISIVVFTPGAPASGTITAVLERGAIAPPVSSSRVLVSGQPTQFTLPAVPTPTFFAGEFGFRIDVPRDSERLEIVLRTNPSNIDLDLFVRFGAEPALQAGRIIADHWSVTDSGNEHLIIQNLTVPPLRTGSYFIALPLYTTNTAVRGTITATVFPRTRETDPGEAAKSAGVPVRKAGTTRSSLDYKPSGPVAVPIEGKGLTTKSSVDSALEAKNAVRKRKLPMASIGGGGQ